MAGLPRDSAVTRATDPEAAQWSTTDELLAGLIEVVDYGNRLFFRAHSKKGSEQPKAVEVRRPAAGRSADEKPKQASSEDIKAFFGTVAYTPPEA